MHILLDNISATLIGGMVMLIFVASQAIGTDATINQTGYHAARAQVYAFGEQLQDDFENFGLGVSTGTNVIQSQTSNQISFWRQLDTSNPTLSTVTYTFVATDTVDVRGTSTPLFTIERSVNGVAEGGGPANMSAFALELRNSDGDAVANEADAFSVHLRFAVLPYFDDEPTLSNLHWSRTYRINS